MTVFDLFSKRQKKLRGEAPDVYTYDNIPEPLRVQIVHIWQDALGNAVEYNDAYGGHVFQAYQLIVDTLRREYGLFELPPGNHHYEDRSYHSELVKFVLQEQDTEKIMDTVELSFRIIDQFTRAPNYYLHRQQSSSKRADAAIKELNIRFQEHGIGYQFIDGEIIRVDSGLIHAEVVKPALALLHGTIYTGAQAEFLQAHEHYRHRRSKETLNECLKALESTMKAICDKRGWKYQHNATCNVLIQICIENKLIPEFWTQQFTSLRSTLESGMPTGRNKLGGHGQGFLCS